MPIKERVNMTLISLPYKVYYTLNFDYHEEKKSLTNFQVFGTFPKSPTLGVHASSFF